MNSVTALASLRRLQSPLVSTHTATSLFDLSISATVKMLTRLSPIVRPIRRGLWAIEEKLNPFSVASYLTNPYPCYISLQTALYFHGMISQIPALIYAVTTDRAKQIETSVGVFSIHKIAPEFFLLDGFDVLEDVHMASPEKALLDVLYLSATRDRRFAALPELELPSNFSTRRARGWIGKIPSARMRGLVKSRFEQLMTR
jgi:predicted transcriptional regulator of viral defense system